MRRYYSRHTDAIVSRPLRLVVVVFVVVVVVVFIMNLIKFVIAIKLRSVDCTRRESGAAHN